MKRYFKLLTFMLVFTLIFGETYMVSAATKSYNMAGKSAKAKVIKKTGTYTINNKSNTAKGYIKFVAPKKGIYTFTFKSLKYKNEDKDAKNPFSGYWDPFNAKNFGKRVAIAMQTGDEDRGWRNMEFDNYNSSYSLINKHEVLYLMFLNGEYESMKDAAKALVDMDTDDVLELLNSGSPTVKLSVKMNKGTTVRVSIIGDKDKTSCTMKIKRN